MKPKIVLLSLGALALFAFAFGAGFALASKAAIPSEAMIVKEFTAYVSSLAPTAELVLVEGKERLDIKDKVKGQLFGDTGLGEFLKIRSDAIIEVEAWAESSYAVSAGPSASWEISYDAKARALSIVAPVLRARTPAILTETIRASVLDKSIFVNEQRVMDALRAGLTQAFVEYAAGMAGTEAIRKEAEGSLSAIATAFAARLGLRVESVAVEFYRSSSEP